MVIPPDGRYRERKKFFSVADVLKERLETGAQSSIFYENKDRIETINISFTTF